VSQPAEPRLPRWTLLVLSAALCLELPVLAAPASLRACPAGTPELAAAQARLAEFSARVAAQDGTAKGDALAGELGQLLASRCFALSAESPRAGPRGPAFVPWWQAGGREWAQSYLKADASGRLASVVLPPDVPPALFPEGATKASGVLKELACPPGEAACGAEAREFRRRAELFFTTARDQAFEQPHNPPASPADLCAREATSGKYVTWRSCIELHRPLVPVLPTGELRSPSTGWLVVQAPAEGRCTRLRFFHVDSGSTQALEVCPAQASAAAVREVPAETGRVSATTLRETLLMLLLSDKVVPAQPSAWRVLLPKGLTPAWPPQADMGVSGSVPGRSPHSTRIRWRWSDGALAPAQGSFDLGWDPGGTYASMLLDVLSAGLVHEPGKVAVPAKLREQAVAAVTPAR
jgi:hypothetical protein